MQIEQRGVPPYKVWNANNERMLFGEPWPPQPGYSGDDYLKAVFEVFNLTDGGKYSGHLTANITDSRGVVVFAANNPEDLALLMEMDKAGMAYTTLAKSVREEK